MGNEGRRPGATALAGLVLVGTTALWLRFNASPPAMGQQFPSDLVNYFYPLAVHAAERLSHAELPLWNPYACSGIPLLATAQVGVFYPGNWLALLLPVEHALPLRLFLECFLGGLFTGLWLRRIGLRVVPCAMAGILFVYACLLGQTFWPPQVATILWLPWLLLCVECLCFEWRWRWWLGLAAGVGLQLVAGFAQYALYTFLLLVPYAAVRLALGAREADGQPRGDDPGPSRVLRAAGMLGAAVLGVGLAGPQLLPTLELVGLGMRSGPVAASQLHYLGALGLGEPGAWFLANAFDPSPKLVSFDYREGSGYLGVATLLLTVFGLVAGRPRHLVWLLAAAGALALLLSFGLRGPLPAIYELFASVPTGGWFRTPERFRLIYLLAWLALATLGLDALTDTARRRRDVRSRVALAATGLMAGGIVLFAAFPAGWRAGVALALIAAVALRRTPPALQVACATALAVFAVVDVVGATGVYGSLRRFPVEWSRSYHVLGTTLYDAEDLGRIRRETGLGRLELLRVLPLTPAPPLAGAYRVACYEPLAPAPWPQLARRMGDRVEWGQLLFDTAPERAAAFHDLAGVRAVLAPDDAFGFDAGVMARRWRRGLGPAPKPDRVAPVRRQNPDALPRAYVIDSFVVRSTEQALDQIVRGGLDFQRIAVVDRDPGFEPADGTAGQARAADIRVYTPERVEIDAHAERDSLLVLSDSFYPGWQARVDGEGVEILRANGVYRAVVLTPGEHRVVFEYRPASLHWGAICCAGALLLLLAIPFAAQRRVLRRQAGSVIGG